MPLNLFRFVDQLLSSESPRTLIQTVVNILQSETITDKTSRTLVKQFYLGVASTLELQFGNILLASSTNAQRQALMKNNCPFFTDDSCEMAKKCLEDFERCDGIQRILQYLGKQLFSL